MKLGIELDSKAALAAFKKAPAVMTKHLARALDRAELEVEREERAEAPKAFSTLTQSIRAYRQADLDRLIAPSVNYARPVVEGSKPGYMPPLGPLMDWIKLRGGMRMARAGSGKRASQESELRDRAYGLALYIRAHGTKPNPFIENTADKMRSRVHQLLREGAAAGVAEAFA